MGTELELFGEPEATNYWFLIEENYKILNKILKNKVFTVSKGSHGKARILSFFHS